MKTTNVEAGDLNYDGYSTAKYDSDILKVIPGHAELHRHIENVVADFSQKHKIKKIADIGIGTGLTSQKILKLVPDASLTGVDFSSPMINGAKDRLQNYDAQFITGDYSEMDFGSDFDLITSVIGIHHQTTEGKKNVFRKIYLSLKQGGLFIFGDLMIYRDQAVTALNDAKHYAFMVEHADDEASLKEWAYHHKFLNNPEPVEDQIEWLKEAGFKNIRTEYQHLNTILLVAEK